MFGESDSVAATSSAWRNYEKLQSIGSGSYGTVYLCRVLDASSDEYQELVAIKCVSLSALGDKEASLAMSEVAILRNLSHPNILRFIDCFIDEEHNLCCVTEYVDGGDLSSVIKTAKKQRRFVDAFVVVDMLRQALEGLAYLHAQAVLHRDIKPGNVYVTRAGTVKIGDFGVSKLVSEAAPHAVTFIGTPFYLCPELCMGEPYSFGADVWALGVSVYELYCLKLPFHASNVLALANIISEGQYDTKMLEDRPLPQAQRQALLSSCGEDYLLKAESLGGMVAALVKSMLTSDPLERPTAHQLLSDFYGVTTAAPDEQMLLEEQQHALEDHLSASSYETSDQLYHQESTTSAAATMSVGTASGGGVGESPTKQQRYNSDAQLVHNKQRSSIVVPSPFVSRQSLARMSLCFQQIVDGDLSQQQKQQQLDNNDDSVCVGDADDVVFEPTSLKSDATSNSPCATTQQSSTPTTTAQNGWAAQGSVYSDPHALEKAIRQKAIEYHQRRRLAVQAAITKAQIASVRVTTTATTTTPSNDPSSNNKNTTAFFTSAYQRGYTRPPQAAYLAPNAMRSTATSPLNSVLRSVTKSLLESAKDASSSHAGAGAAGGFNQSNNVLRGTQVYNPPRVHFSDEDDEAVQPVKTKITLTNSKCSSASDPRDFDDTVTLNVRKVRANTTLKRLIKRILVAIRLARTSTAPKNVEKALWLQARIPEGMDDILKELDPAAWFLSSEDDDGDLLSFSTNKEWKLLLKKHLEAQEEEEDDSDDDEDGDDDDASSPVVAVLQLHSAVLSSLSSPLL